MQVCLPQLKKGESWGFTRRGYKPKDMCFTLMVALNYLN